MNFDDLKKLGWTWFNSGGNCILFAKDIILKDGEQGCIMLNDETLGIYNTSVDKLTFDDDNNMIKYWNLCNFESKHGQHIEDMSKSECLMYDVEGFDYYKEHFHDIKQYFEDKQLREIEKALNFYNEM